MSSSSSGASNSGSEDSDEDEEQPFHPPPASVLNLLSDSEVSESGVSAALRDDSRLAVVVSQLREIVGGDASQEQLEEVAIAADYDVNRAVNYFFSL